MRDDSAEILFQSFFFFFLREAIVNSYGMNRDVHSLMLSIVNISGMNRDAHSLLLSIQRFLCRRRRHPLQGALKDDFGEAVVACDMPEPCKFPSLDSCQKRSRGPTMKLSSLCIQSFVLCSKRRCRDVFSGAWFRKPGSFFSESASRVHASQP